MGLIHLYRLLKDYLIIFLGKRLPDSRYLFCTKTFTGAPWRPLPRLTGFHGSPGQPGTLWPVSSVLLHWVPFLHPLYSRNLLNYLVHSRPHSHLKKKQLFTLMFTGLQGKELNMHYHLCFWTKRDRYVFISHLSASDTDGSVRVRHCAQHFCKRWSRHRSSGFFFTG